MWRRRRAWDGPEGERWAAHATGYERANDRQWRRFLELVPIREADRILDVGCGNGRSTCDLARLATAGARPFSFADRDRVRERVEAAGFRNVMLQDLDEPTALRALDVLKEALARRATPEGILFGASSWLVTASA